VSEGGGQVWTLLVTDRCSTRTLNVNIGVVQNIYGTVCEPCRVTWGPVTTAWHVVRLLMEERPPVMEGSCEYIE
jgi:hypothetical protein